MRITPLDIYQQEFRRVFRGVDPDEVEDFLERVADDYEQLIRENATLKKQIESLETQLAVGTATDVVQQAKEEAREEKARDEAHEIGSDEAAHRELIEKARMEELELRREISKLRGQKERFLTEYRELLEKHLRILTEEA